MTSIKPPLILIHFVVSRELLLIKCVPDCIMGVSRGPLHKVNSPHYSHQTLVCAKFLNTDGDGSRRPVFASAQHINTQAFIRTGDLLCSVTYNNFHFMFSSVHVSLYV